MFEERGLPPTVVGHIPAIPATLLPLKDFEGERCLDHQREEMVSEGSHDWMARWMAVVDLAGTPRPFPNSPPHKTHVSSKGIATSIASCY